MRTVAGRAAPLALPAPAAAPDLVATACAGGWSPLEHRTRAGVRTVAWYRGPGAPVRVAPNPQPAFPSGDAALLLDPASGMFDVSYASAWQLGRLLALRNRAFTSTWSGWIRDLCAGAHAAAEPEDGAEATARVAEHLTAQAPLGPVADPSGVRDEAHRLPGLEAVDATPAPGEDPALAVAREALGGAP
jgi:hypothetical protein